MLCKFQYIFPRNALLNSSFQRPLLAGIAERYSTLRRPRTIPTSIVKNEQAGLYTSCSFDDITGEKMTCTLSILPQVDQLPSLFTYVSLQRNFLVNSSQQKSIEKNLSFFLSVIRLQTYLIY